jgi:hypothetical protein
MEFETVNEGQQWEVLLKEAFAAAVCNEYYEPINVEAPRLSESLIESAMAKLITLDQPSYLNQGRRLLKARQHMTELLTRLQNGGIDFISFSEIEHLHKLTASLVKGDPPFCSKDSDTKRISLLWSAMKKKGGPSRQTKRMAYSKEVYSTIDDIIRDLQKFPICDDSASETSSTTTSTENSPNKIYSKECEEVIELAPGSDVFVEASSVTVCIALPVKREKKEQQEEEPGQQKKRIEEEQCSLPVNTLPVAVKSPQKQAPPSPPTVAYSKQVPHRLQKSDKMSTGGRSHRIASVHQAVVMDSSTFMSTILRSTLLLSLLAALIAITMTTSPDQLAQISTSRGSTPQGLRLLDVKQVTISYNSQDVISIVPKRALSIKTTKKSSNTDSSSDREESVSIIVLKLLDKHGRGARNSVSRLATNLWTATRSAVERRQQVKMMLERAMPRIVIQR